VRVTLSAVTDRAMARPQRHRPYWKAVWLLIAAVFFLTPSRAAAAVSITVTPSMVNLPASGTQQFTATVTGSSDTSVTWTIQEGPTGGSVTSSGLYSAPGVVGAVYHVVATSHADGSQSATATVVVPGFIYSGLTTARACHTATLLPSGKVLYAGGQSNIQGALPNAAEVYDPGADRSVPAPNLTTGRCFHTATLLPNGKVLLAGGQLGGGGETATAELYDPVSGTFTATGSMSIPRTQHSATLLSSGKVLIAGGMNCNPTCSALSSAELYEPSSGTFSSTGSMNGGRTPFTAAVLLANGTVLIPGGSGGADLYDPTTGMFTATGVFIDASEGSTITLLSNGKVLVVGGLPGGVPTAKAAIYDPSSRTYTQTGNLSTPRDYHTATLLPSGKVLIAGGSATLSRAASAELYDPGTGTFSMTGRLHDPRIWHTATLLPSGKVLVAAGANTVLLASTEFYDPATGVFTTDCLFMNVGRVSHTATQLPDGRILLIGGVDDTGNVTPSAEIYDPGTGKFTLTGSLSTGRWGHTATLLNNGKVLVAGGVSDANGFVLLPTAELYDPASGTFSLTGNLSVLHTYHTATLLPNGKVLVAGGLDPHTLINGSFASIASAELYDPTSGMFSSTASMNEPRYWHTATLLNNGRVLIAGGTVVAPPTLPPLVPAPGELYDPAAGSFTNTGDPNQTPPSTGPSAATLLQDGQVLLWTTTIYDPAANTFTTTPAFQHAPPFYLQANYTATLLPNEEVLVAGGGNGGAAVTATLLDPARASWVDAGSMQSPRVKHTANLLSNGLVLIAGGEGNAGLHPPMGFASAQLYQPPVLASAPSVTAISPNPISGFTPVSITVQGANFVAGAFIQVDLMKLPATYISSTQLSATIPLQAPGAHNVTVTNVDGETSVPFVLTVNNPLFWANTANGSSIDFGTVPIGATSSRFLDFANQGNVPLNFSLTITGANSGDFAVDVANSTCPLQVGAIQPGVDCNVYIKFVPQALAQSNATLTFTYNGPGGPFQVTLTGAGAAPTLPLITPPNLVFGDQIVGTSSTPQSVTLSNPGSVTLGIFGVALTNTADFSMTNTCGSSLMQGASCAITVTFTPTFSGSRTGAVAFSATDSYSPQTIPLTGMGTNFSIAPITGSSSSATVTAGQPATYQLNLSPQVFSGSVTLSCVETTTIPNTTCTIAPANPVMLSGTTATPVTVTVATKSHSGMAIPTQMWRFLRPNVFEVQTIGGLSYLLALLVMIVVSRRGWKRSRLALSTAFLFAMLVTGCGAGGNGGGGSNPPPSGSAGTPAGTYQLLVTASSSGVTRTMTLSLTVQ
jgi:hypothetical protein